MRSIEQICEDMHTQNNRITALPLFVVERKLRQFGVDPEFSCSGHVWVEEVCGERDEVSPLRAKRLDSIDKYRVVPDKYECVYYLDRWEFVTACFTENGCKRYLELNGHNLGETRIFVHSGYRNEEWGTVRNHIMKQESPCAKNAPD